MHLDPDTQLRASGELPKQDLLWPEDDPSVPSFCQRSGPCQLRGQQLSRLKLAYAGGLTDFMRIVRMCVLPRTQDTRSQGGARRHKTSHAGDMQTHGLGESVKKLSQRRTARRWVS